MSRIRLKEWNESERDKKFKEQLAEIEKKRKKSLDKIFSELKDFYSEEEEGCLGLSSNFLLFPIAFNPLNIKFFLLYPLLV